MSEFCIMPKSNHPFYKWENERKSGLHRHECWYGNANRKKSIEDGLVIFLKPEYHDMSKKGVHYDKDFRLYTELIAELTWLKYYNKTEEDFIKRYGKSVIYEWEVKGDDIFLKDNTLLCDN